MDPKFRTVCQAYILYYICHNTLTKGGRNLHMRRKNYNVSFKAKVALELCKELKTVNDAIIRIGSYSKIYNYERLHQSLNYETPVKIHFGSGGKR